MSFCSFSSSSSSLCGVVVALCATRSLQWAESAAVVRPLILEQHQQQQLTTRWEVRLLLRGGSSEDEEEDEEVEEDEWDGSPHDDEEDDEDDADARAARRAQRWTRRAFDAAQRGRMEQAAVAFEKAVQATPEDAPYRASLLINAGSFLAFSGRARDALGPLREALSLSPDDARALHALGNALHQCDAPGDALEVYARALDASPTVDFPPNAPLLNNVATILLGNGDRELATRVLERSLDIEPSAPGTLFNLAMAYYSEAVEACGGASKRKKRRFVASTRVPVRLARADVWLETRAISSSRASMRALAGRDMRRVIALLDRAEPHAPPGSALRERVLALRGVAAARVPGRESDAISDLEDVLAHGVEHARDPKRRANALLELAALVSDPNERLSILRDAVAALAAEDDSNPAGLVLDAAAAATRKNRSFFFKKEDPSRHRRRRLRGLRPPRDDHRVLHLGQPRDAASSLRALARAELANALVDRDDCDGAFSCYFAAADDGLGATGALLDSPRAAKLKRADPRRFDDLVHLVCRNDAFAAIQALTSALSAGPNPNHSARSRADH
ncbi:hypothetical protein CTAYLR_007457 [Chrysophaeum taylorii]|uniref:Uncharacterized protein n=1 Tax=Chrysophaeum taylorii TaxID=2483200 RepID=A0AAD7UB96_9STRA|nr:hypothetical protein CTAYLR_007457 [Chrysophaeum taylorii]